MKSVNELWDTVCNKKDYFAIWNIIHDLRIATLPELVQEKQSIYNPYLQTFFHLQQKNFIQAEQILSSVKAAEETNWLMLLSQLLLNTLNPETNISVSIEHLGADKGDFFISFASAFPIYPGLVDSVFTNPRFEPLLLESAYKVSVFPWLYQPFLFNEHLSKSILDSSDSSIKSILLFLRNDYKSCFSQLESKANSSSAFWVWHWFAAKSAFEIGKIDYALEKCSYLISIKPFFWYAREMPKHTTGFFAQLGQDEIIDTYFEHFEPKEKTCIEIGAFDGIHYSNVRRLITQQNWKSILVEPVHDNFKRLEFAYRNYPNAQLINKAISSEKGKLPLHVSAFSGVEEWGSDVASLLADEKARWDTYNPQWHIEEVECITIQELVKIAGFKHIDVLSIDAEGYDLEVLKTLNFDEFKPELIIIEYGSLKQEIIDFALSKGYFIYDDNGQDLFFSKSTDKKISAPPRYAKSNYKLFSDMIQNFVEFDYTLNSEADYLNFESQYRALSLEEKHDLLNSLDKENTDHDLLRGLLLKSVDKSDEAIALLTSVIKTNSSDWRAYIGLAFTLYLTKESQKIALAEKVLTLCSSLHPHLETPHALLESFTNECAFHGDPFYQKIVPTLVETYNATSFVETGTYLGHSSEFIAKRFPNLPLYTTEVNQDFFDIATNRLKKYASVSMYKQHTLDFLRQTLVNIDLGERPVFFIDAHWEHDWPLIDELNHIKVHYPNAVLVIDDMKVPFQAQFPYDSYEGDKVCDLEHIVPVIGEMCSSCIIPVYSEREVAPYTSLSGYGIFALQQDEFLNSLLENPELALDFSIYSFADLKLDSIKEKPVKIIGLMAAKNESALIEFSLRALAPYVDSIVLFDDNSSDDTVLVARKLHKQCKIESILEKSDWDYNETHYRQALLDEGRRLGGTHFICLDADEAFTSNFTVNDELRKTITQMEPGDKLIFHWLQLWRSTLKVRRDASVWTNNTKVFAFADDGVSNYHAQEFHLLRSPQGLSGKNIGFQSDTMGVMHFQFVNWENLLIKQAWYRCLELVKDESKSVAEINERYAPSKDETGLGLVDVPLDWFKSYPFFSPCYFTQLETWRSKQVISWFDEKGLDFFKELDIWDVDWNSHRNRLAQTQQIKSIDPFNLMKAPLSEAEKHIIQLVEPMQGWFTDSEKLALFRMTKAQPENGKVLEIGSFMGRSTNAIAHASIHTNREIYALDVWLDFGEDLDDRAQSENGIHILNTFLRNTQWFNEKLRVLKGSTTQYKYLLSNLQFDLIFVDAAHDYFNVCNDVRIALTAIKPNGWMIGHDYHNMGGEEVIKAVHDTLFDREEIKIKGVFEGTTVWFAQIPEGFKV